MDKCPHCQKDIRKELIHEVFGKLKGHDFEHECSFCGALLEVEVVPVPEFEMSVKEPPNTAYTGLAETSAKLSGLAQPANQ